LLILDNLESILQADSAGQYRQGYGDYGTLIQQVGKSNHQSCLILTSRERPRDLAKLQGPKLPVRCWSIAGLTAQASLEILNARGLDIHETDPRGDTIINRCGGNPQILRFASTEIQELFFGDITEFLQERVTSLEDVKSLLDEQVSRLSPLEQTVTYWLAINREPVTIDELMGDLLPPVSKHELRVALRALVNRSLIEEGTANFTLQNIEKETVSFTLPNVVMEYLTEQLVQQIQTELQSQQFQYFHSHALMKATAKTYVRDTQIRLILKPIADSLDDLEEQVKTSLKIIRQNTDWGKGYAAGNLLNLLCQYQLEVCNFDFLLLQSDRSI